MSLRTLMALLAALLMSACNLGPNPGGDDDDSADDDDDDDDSTPTGPIDATITDLTSGAVELETDVVITGAVVTTAVWNDEDDNQAGFWIQQGEGPGTGILVFTFFDVGTDIVASGLSIGDEVTIEGRLRDPFGDFLELSINEASAISVTGQGTVPAPTVVAASDLAQGFVSDEGLVGVLVSVEDVTVDASPGFNNFFTWRADDVFVSSPRYGEDAWMYADVWEGYAVESITGVAHRSFGDVKIMARTQEDVVFSYPGCDDTDGLDVQDLNCEGSIGDDVTLTGLVVVSPEPFFGDSVWAMDPAADSFGGVQLFWTDDDVTLPAIGDIVDVEGEADEYRGQTEVIIFDPADVSVTGSGDATPVAVADACDIGEHHEGMLVTIPSVTVDAQDGDAEDFGYFTVTGCPLVKVGAVFWTSPADFASDTGNGGEIVNLVGVVVDSNNEYRINPRTTADWDSWAE